MRVGRAIAGGLIAEILLILVVVPGAVLGREQVVIWSAVIGAPITTFLAALWVCRRLDSHFVQHGALAGLAAMLIYLIPVLAGGIAQPPIYWLGHALKVLGGVAGGMFAARRFTSTTRVVAGERV
jgi:hypothetical protein